MSAERIVPGSMPRTLHTADLAPGTDREYDPDAPDCEAVDGVEDANVVSSLERGADPKANPIHYPVLDIDRPCVLVESSTPGHYHLYIDVAVGDGAYWAMCEAMAEAQILQPGYVAASKRRGYTSVRLPWIRKPEPEPGPF